MKVVAGILYNHRGDVLITQRALSSPKGGLWEFPGGKVEGTETLIHALERELQEELGVQIESPVHTLTLTEPGLELTFFTVKTFQGEPTCLESQLALRWVNPTKLDAFSFPKLNRRLIETLCVS